MMEQHEAAPRPFAPLTGRHILEWCSQAAGPFTGKVLAALGADVIKIEAPGRGDESREAGPFPGDIPDRERSALFLFLNNGKRSITLDPTSAPGRALLLRLVAEWADVVVEDRPPALLEQLELTYAVLAATRPNLVVVSVTPFGQTGPYRDFRTYPSQTSHAGGASYLLPDGFHYAEPPLADLPPMQWPRFVADTAVGVLAAGATLAALFARDSTGAGQHIDVSKQEAVLHIVRSAVDTYPNGEPAYARRPTRASSLAGTYACADGYVSLWPAGFGPRRDSDPTRDLAVWLGNPPWSLSEAWCDPEQRNQRAAEFRGLIQQEFLRFTMDELYHGLQARNMVVAPVYPAARVLKAAQMRSRAFFHTVQDASAGALPYPGLPFICAGLASPAPGTAPRLGQHTDEVLGGLLGLAEADLARLRAEAVL